MSTSPARIFSTTLSGPSLNLPTTSASTPLRRNTCAVPTVTRLRQQAFGTQLGDRRAERDARRCLRQLHRGRLRHERDGPARARVGLQHIEHIAGERVLHVYQPTHPDAFGELERGTTDR